MPSKRSQFAVICSLLVVLHLGSVSALWVNSTNPSSPTPVSEGPDADGATLLAAAHHNDGVFSTTSTVRLVDTKNESNYTELRIETDPSTGRMRAQMLEHGPNNPLVGEDVYLTPWGRWVRHSDGWTFEPGEEAAYDSADARILRPSIHSTTAIEKTVHENGSVTVTLTNSDPGLGMLSFAGSNVTCHYRIAFQDGRPYFIAASAEPTTEDGLYVRVQRRRGAQIQRPADAPWFTGREIRERIVEGGTHE